MQSKLILLVDDNADDVYLTIDAFRRTELASEIIVAQDGVEAIDMLLPVDGTPGLRPAIVLLDINMPRMGGLEVLSRLRADPRTKALPVIMLTSSAEDRDVLGSYQSGANSYVQKPVTSAEFLAAAKILGIYWLGMNVQAPI